MPTEDREAAFVPTSSGFRSAGVAFLLAFVGLVFATVLVGLVGQDDVLAAAPTWLADPVRSTVGEYLPLVMFVGVWQFLGVGALLYGGTILWKWARVRRRSVSPVADVTPGSPVELAGTATPDQGTVTAPLSDAECLLYNYQIEAYDPDSDSGSNWNTVAGGTECVPFQLVDETGSVIVDPAGATFHVTRASTTEVVTSDDDTVPAGVERLTDVADVDIGLSDGGGPDDRYRLTERFRITPGEEVYLSGIPSAGERMDRISAPASVGSRLKHYLSAPFLVSDSAERRLEGALLRRGGKSLALGVVLVAITAWIQSLLV